MGRGIDFNRDLKRGAEGVKRILQLPGFTAGGDGTVEDVFFLGQPCEVKTDSYVSENFAMETYYDWDKQKIGGPWRAASVGCKVFVYYFSETGEVYLFPDIEALNTRLEELQAMQLGRYVYIRNPKWVTEVHLVRKEDLDGYYWKLNIEVEGGEV